MNELCLQNNRGEAAKPPNAKALCAIAEVNKILSHFITATVGGKSSIVVLE